MTFTFSVWMPWILCAFLYVLGGYILWVLAIITENESQRKSPMWIVKAVVVVWPIVVAWIVLSPRKLPGTP